MKTSVRLSFCLCAILFALCSLSTAESKPKPTKQALRFQISIAAGVSGLPLDGRMMLAISTKDKPEPRFSIVEQEAESQQFFAVDVNGVKAGAPVDIDAGALGYPVRSVEQLPAGDYYVQAVLNIYETFHRADGHVVKLPPEMGEGQQWNRKPGNFYSKPEKVHIDPAAGGVVRITLTEKIAPVAPRPDTKYVKHFRLESKLLSQFWGQPVALGAIVVLPEGFEEHPEAHYPVVVFQGHFPADYTFRSEPPTPEMKGAERDAAEYSYKLYQDWTSGRLPKMILLEIQHANPYYDDSYSVNSENLGPYGDAIVRELLPEVERRYRGIGQPWARALMGGSTGGWEAIADQVFYPDDFNGAWGFCPDPVDFHAYQNVNIYEDKNAFWAEGPFGKVPRGEMRTSNGTLLAAMEPAVRREEVMGTHGRSTEQFGIWQAVFSPVGADGYPAPIWDPATGVIDAKVAAYWRDHYDLDHIMQRDWATLGPKLAGKLHIAVGDMDTWYLNNAVHLMQDFLDSPKNPYRVAEFDYGDMQPHCYTGGGSSIEAKRTMVQRTLPQIAEHMKKTAPAEADKSWEY